MGEDIASANYQQEPIDLKGRLYTSFKTYSGELPQFKEIRNYTDTADTGEDYLCSINYGVTFAGEAYVLDVLYQGAHGGDRTGYGQNALWRTSKCV